MGGAFFLVVALLKYLHVFAGVLWMGGALGSAVVLYPHLGRLTAAGARESWAGQGRRLAALTGASAGVSMVFGGLTAVASGYVTSPSDIFLPYGRLVMLALLLAVLREGVAGVQRRKLSALMHEEELWRAEGRARLRHMGLLDAAVFAVILGIMVALGYGVY